MSLLRDGFNRSTLRAMDDNAFQEHSSARLGDDLQLKLSIRIIPDLRGEGLVGLARSGSGS